MSEKRYTFQTCAKFLNVSVATIQYRASKLEIETKFGITDSDLRSIRDYPNRRIGRRYTRSTMQELQEEMEALK